MLICILTKTSRINETTKRLKKAQGRFAIVVNAIVCDSKRAEQPAPDCALMIRSIAITGASAVMAAVSGFARRKTPQSIRGQETPCANIDDFLLLLCGERAHR